MGLRADVIPIRRGSLGSGSAKNAAPEGDHVARLDDGSPSPRSKAESPLSPDVVAAAQAGDVGAQAEFFRHAWPIVHGLVYRLLGADGEAADVAQDVFVQALGSLPSLRDPHAWSFWLRGIAIRVVRRKLRTRRLLRTLGLYQPAPVEDFSLVVSSEVPADVAAEFGEFRALLGHLGDDVRLLISLRYVEDMSLPEIAAHLGISLSTVKRRYQTAHEAIERRSTPGVRRWLTDRARFDGGEP